MSRAMLVVVFLVLANAGFSLAATPRTVEIRADSVTSRERGDVLEARGHVVITDGRVTVRGDRATYARRDARIVLDGRVSAATPEGSLRAARIILLLNTNGTLATIETTGGVTVNAQHRSLTADAVTYHVQQDTLVAAGGVTLKIPPGLTATAKDLVARGRDTVTLTGRPRLQTRDGVIEGNRIEYLTSTQTAHVRGDVTAHYRDTRITAGTATLSAGEGKVVFRDGVTVVQPRRSLSATIVTLFYRENRLVTEGETNIRIEESP